MGSDPGHLVPDLLTGHDHRAQVHIIELVGVDSGVAEKGRDQSIHLVTHRHPVGADAQHIGGDLSSSRGMSLPGIHRAQEHIGVTFKIDSDHGTLGVAGVLGRATGRIVVAQVRGTRLDA